MSHFAPPRHPMVEQALRLSRHYCTAKIIDGAPALAHACKVATVLAGHVPDATPQMIAAALLHDAPEYAGAGADLDAVLSREVGPGVAALVLAIHDEHQAMMSGTRARIPAWDAVTRVMAADKVVAFAALVRRARRAPDPGEFWDQRVALRRLLPWFAAWCELAGPVLPESLSSRLIEAYQRLSAAAAAHGRSTNDCRR